MTDLAFKVRAGEYICEQVGLLFGTTGSQGGNHSHGGHATLELRFEGGCHLIEVDAAGKNLFRADASDLNPEGAVVRITSCGDWELEGFMDALIQLGTQLAQHRARLGWAKWMEDEDQIVGLGE